MIRCFGPLAMALTLFFLAHPCSAAAIPETEVREFTIEIDGKAAGTLLMTITKQDTGILSVQSKANTTFKYLAGLRTYTYSLDCTEHWKDGRVLQMNAKCDDNGTKTDLTAMAQGDSLQLTVNGRQRKCPGDVWTTTYWMLADKRFHNNKVPLLDSDTGIEYIGQLKYAGVDKVMIGGQQQDCYHFHVTGGPTSPCDLWYDGQLRLVRQEFVDQGKRVVVILTALRRN
jgi:hypothetical protein